MTRDIKRDLSRGVTRVFRYPMRRNEYKQPDMFNGKRDDNIDHIAKSVDNIRLAVVNIS